MKKITIYYKGLGYCDTFQADIFVFYNNVLIKKTKTYNGRVILYLEEDKLYEIKAISKNEEISKKIYLSSNNLTLCFSFPRTIINNKITFYLTDSFYKNLKIAKREILLWQKK